MAVSFAPAGDKTAVRVTGNSPESGGRRGRATRIGSDQCGGSDADPHEGTSGGERGARRRGQRPVRERSKPATGAVVAAVETAWRTGLQTDELDGDADFFALGGDSLAAMVVIADLQERLGIAATFADLLEAPTLDAFVARVTTMRRHRPATASRRSRGSRTAPLTRSQRSRWQTRKSTPAGAENHWIYRVDGPLNVDALRGAVDELVRRHEVLRTLFRRRFGRPRQVVQPWRPGYLRVVDMSSMRQKNRDEAALRSIMEHDYGYFDYRHGPLVRATLAVLGRQQYLFSFATSEMVFDGSSRRIFTGALSTLYDLIDREGDAADYPYPPIQFRDFARARTELVGRMAYAKQLVYWQERVRDLEPWVVLRDLPTAPTEVPEGRPVCRTLRLPGSFVDRVHEAARASATTSFNLLAAAFVVLLRTLTDADRVPFTTPIGRRDVAGAEHLIGSFFTNLYLAVSLEGVRNGTELVAATAAVTREAFAHSDVPLPQVSAFFPRRDDGIGIPAGEVRFQIHEYPGEIRLGRPAMRRVTLPPVGTQFHFCGIETPDGALDLDFAGRPDIPRRVADDILPGYRRVLQALVSDPAVPVEQLLREAQPQGGYARSLR